MKIRILKDVVVEKIVDFFSFRQRIRSYLFWRKSAKYTREERRKSIKDENFGHDDFTEWKDL